MTVSVLCVSHNTWAPALLEEAAQHPEWAPFTVANGSGTFTDKIMHVRLKSAGVPLFHRDDLTIYPMVLSYLHHYMWARGQFQDGMPQLIDRQQLINYVRNGPKAAWGVLDALCREHAMKELTEENRELFYLPLDVVSDDDLDRIASFVKGEQEQRKQWRKFFAERKKAAK